MRNLEPFAWVAVWIITLGGLNPSRIAQPMLLVFAAVFAVPFIIIFIQQKREYMRLRSVRTLSKQEERNGIILQALGVIGGGTAWLLLNRHDLVSNLPYLIFWLAVLRLVYIASVCVAMRGKDAQK